MNKPPFDPSQPFSAMDKPAFDPSQPFEPVEEGTSALGAASRGAVGMLPMGEQAMAAGKTLEKQEPANMTEAVLESAASSLPGVGGLARLGAKAGENPDFAQDYTKNREELAKTEQKDVEQHPEARGVGQAAGFVAPAAVNALGDAASGTGGGALVGGMYGAGDALDVLMKHGFNKESALEALKLVGKQAGIGGATGMALSGASKFVPKNVGEEASANASAQALGVPARQFVNAVPKGMSSDQFVNTELRPWLDQHGVVKLNSTPSSILEEVQKVHEQAGQKIGQIWDKVSAQGKTPNLSGNIISALNSAAQDSISHGMEQRATLTDFANKLSKESEKLPLSYKDLMKEKSKIGKVMGAGGQNAQRVAPVYDILNDALMDASENLHNGVPGLRGELETANKDYRISSRLMKGLRISEARDLVSKGTMLTSPSKLVTAPIRAVSKLVAPNAVENTKYMAAPWMTPMFQKMANLAHIAPQELWHKYFEGKEGEKDSEQAPR